MIGAIQSTAIESLARTIADDLMRGGLDVGRIKKFDRGMRIRLKNEFKPLWIECLPPSEHLDQYVCQIMPEGPVAWRWLRRVDISSMRANLVQVLERVLENNTAISHVSSWYHGGDKILR